MFSSIKKFFSPYKHELGIIDEIREQESIIAQAEAALEKSMKIDFQSATHEDFNIAKKMGESIIEQAHINTEALTYVFNQYLEKYHNEVQYRDLSFFKEHGLPWNLKGFATKIDMDAAHLRNSDFLTFTKFYFEDASEEITKAINWFHKSSHSRFTNKFKKLYFTKVQKSIAKYFLSCNDKLGHDYIMSDDILTYNSHKEIQIITSLKFLKTLLDFYLAVRQEAHIQNKLVWLQHPTMDVVNFINNCENFKGIALSTKGDDEWIQP